MAASGREEILTEAQTGTMLEASGDVRFRRGSEPEKAAVTPQPLDFNDLLRTTERARASGLFIDWSAFRLKPQTILKIERSGSTRPNLKLEEGAIYFSSRGGAQGMSIDTPHAKGIPRGTEFLVTVEPERTEFTMFDGEVDLSTDSGQEIIRAGQQGIALPNGEIQVRPILEANNIVQWWIYYPAVLNSGELGFSPAAWEELQPSITNYIAGDLLMALEQFRQTDPLALSTEAHRIYHAGLLVSVGAVGLANAELGQVNQTAPLARALRIMIHAVTSPLANSLTPPSPEDATGMVTSSELLALSYAHQATNNLELALRTAQEAVKTSIDFGFAWARVAELEFSLGHNRSARRAVEHALTLSPRNAQAHALHGFLLASENRTTEAIEAFDRAIAIDPGLGNAWLGRGLCKRRRWRSTGKSEDTDWMTDLQTAAALEPTRSLTRSYAGKAFGDAGDTRRAEEELAFAKKLDPKDPTPWLYGALLDREHNRINQAISGLEQSVLLNTNRAVYRSQMLLDQDLAVRSSSLATIYQSAGMNEVAVREAARAVSYDYANYSAHLFLSDSFNALRDPTRFNLRFETVWFNELLLANLLSPVGGTPLAQNISQQEYSRLFARNRIGLTSSTKYRSDGQIRQLASQYGWMGNTSWALDLDYQHNDGIRPNNELDRLEWYTTIKQQLTPQDSLLLLTKYQDFRSGDNFQYLDPELESRPNFTFEEFQHPIVVGGYHHQWRPGVHTLFLGGRLESQQRFTDKDANRRIIRRDATNQIVFARQFQPMDIEYDGEFEIYTAELKQIFQSQNHTVVAGGRFQTGEFNTQDRLTLPPDTNPLLFPFFMDPPAAGDASEPFERISTYGYYTWEPRQDLAFTAGLTYDQILIPRNHRSPPISSGTDRREHLSPKFATVYSPTPSLTLRGIYAQSLGGVSFDESFRLEPTQLAGFDYAYRSVISESLVGSVSAPTFERAAGAIDLKLASRTYLGFQGGLLRSRVQRELGVFDRLFMPAINVPGANANELDYSEISIGATLNQLVGDYWSFGLQYQFTRSKLKQTFPAIPIEIGGGSPNTFDRSDLHRVNLFGLVNLPSGMFARGELNWFIQNGFKESYNLNSALVREEVPPESFPLVNAWIGYRFPRQRGEVSIGVLNLIGNDYRLNPVNLYPEMPRERVFAARLSFRL